MLYKIPEINSSALRRAVEPVPDVPDTHPNLMPTRCPMQVKTSTAGTSTLWSQAPHVALAPSADTTETPPCLEGV